MILALPILVGWFFLFSTTEILLTALENHSLLSLSPLPLSLSDGSTFPLPLLSSSPLSLLILKIELLSFSLWFLSQSLLQIPNLFPFPCAFLLFPFLLSNILLSLLFPSSLPFSFMMKASFWMVGIWVLWILFLFCKQLRNWKGPFPVPLFGNALGILSNVLNLHDYEAGYVGEHGPCHFMMFSSRGGYTDDPRDVEHILKSNQANYIQGPLRKRMFYDLLGDGIFTADGHNWLIQRKSASRVFSVSQFRDYMADVFAEGAWDLMGALRQPGTIDLQDLFFRYTLQSFVKVAFGQDLKTFKAQEQPPFAKAFDKSTYGIEHRFTDPTWSLKRFFQIGAEKELSKALNIIDSYAYEIIDGRKKENLKSLEKRKDLLSYFISLKDEHGNSPSNQHLRDLVINFILAGRDTTASALSWLFFELTQHPEIVQKVTQEITEILGTIEKGDEAIVPSYDQMKKMELLHAVVTETLRLHPPVPIDPKNAVDDDVLPSGLHIQGGQFIYYMPYAMGRSSKLYDNPLSFDPFRWLKNGKFQRPSPFSFPVFQAGPRQCLGMDFAYLEAKLLTCVLLQKFQFKLEKDPSLITYQINLTMPIKDGLPVSATEL